MSEQIKHLFKSDVSDKTTKIRANRILFLMNKFEMTILMIFLRILNKKYEMSHIREKIQSIIIV